MVYIILVHHRCSSGLLGPHPTTIHYTPPRFILKDHGLQLLGNPPKQVAVRAMMINPKINLGLTRGWWRLHKTYCFWFHWDSVSRRHRTSKLCIYTPDYVAPPTPTTHQPFNFNIQEKPLPRLSFPMNSQLSSIPLPFTFRTLPNWPIPLPPPVQGSPIG